MICNPFIHTTTGEIEWFPDYVHNVANSIYGKTPYVSYADFEREKLKELANGEGRDWQYSEDCLSIHPYGTKGGAFQISRTQMEKPWNLEWLNSYDLTDYAGDDYCLASESQRLLARAEFLKAVCEKEGVEWLPKKHEMMPTADSSAAISDCCGDSGGFCVSIGSNEKGWHYECFECKKPCHPYEPDNKATQEDKVCEEAKPEYLKDLPNITMPCECCKYGIHKEECEHELDRHRVIFDQFSCSECGYQANIRAEKSGDDEIDYYTKEEVDTRIKNIWNEMAYDVKRDIEHFDIAEKEEKEWRKALLDFLEEELLPLAEYDRTRMHNRIEDLRSRLSV